VASRLAAVLRVTASTCASCAVLFAQADHTVWDGVYSEAQAKRGEAIYADRCSTCHAPDLTGMGQASPLTGADFAMDWNDLSMNDLFDRTRVTMPADKPGTLTPQETADVLAYVLQKNGMPAGAADLSTDAGSLKALRYLGKKP
jgi:mono/diheme cytochrome c family protein